MDTADLIEEYRKRLAKMGPGTTGFLLDPQSWRDMAENAKALVATPEDIPASVARGFTTSQLGWPVDIANMALAGKGGEKPVMGSAWLGEKLTGAGLLPEKRDSPTGNITEFLSGLATPQAVANAPVTVAKAAKGTAKATSEVVGDVARNYAASRTLPAGSPRAQAGQAPLFGGKEISAAERTPLVVSHNLKAENLRYATDELGGHLPGASFAVSTPENIPTNFGNISLIARPEVATPRGPWNAKVYAADAYLPRFPNVEPAPMRQETMDNVRSLVDPVRGWWRDPGRTYYGDYNDSVYNLIAEIQKTKPDELHRLHGNPLLAASFLRERGRLPKLLDRDTAPPGSTAAWENYNNLSRELTAMDNHPHTMGDYNEWLEGLHQRIGHKPEKQIVQQVGNRTLSPVPFSVDNIAAVMSGGGDSRVLRGAEWDPGGMHHTRAVLAPEFRTLEGIKKGRKRIVEPAEMNVEYMRAADERAALAQRWGFGEDRPGRSPRKPDPRTLGHDIAREYRGLPQHAATDDLRLTDKYPFLKYEPQDYKAAMQWAANLKNMPATYFEGKAIGHAPHAARDFEAAIVSNAHPDDFVQLERAGFKPEQIHEAERKLGPLPGGIPGGAVLAEGKPGEVIEGNERLRKLLFSLGIPLGVGAGALGSQEAEAGPLDALGKVAKLGRMSKAEAEAAGLWHGIGGKKLEKPISEMTYEATDIPGVTKAPLKTVTPEAMQGGVIVPFVGDRTAVHRVTSIDGKPLSTPIDSHGGPDYMRVHGGWASTDTAARTLANKLMQAGESGKPVYGASVSMGHRGGDFSTMMADTMMAQIAASKIPKKAVQEFDAAVRAARPEWKGLNHPEARAQLHEEVGELRKAVIKVMDTAKFRKLGFPSLPEARHALTDPRLLHDPDYSSGRAISRMDTSGALTPASHPTYTQHMAGDYVGGTDIPIPNSLMWRDWYKGRRADPDKLERLDYRSLEKSKPIQHANQQWLDEIMRYYEALKRGAAAP